LFFIAETFFGWESAAFLAEETKNPEKVMPKAMIYGTIIIALMAITLVISSLGNIHWQVFGELGAPLADLGRSIFGKLGGDLFSLGVYLAIIGAVACWVVASPRLILALARDKLFLSQFAKIHPKYNTPYRAIILQTIITCTLILLVGGMYRMLLLLLIPLAITLYTFTLISLVILRFKKPELKRYFKVPFGKIGPILIILFNTFLIIMWATHEEGALDSLRLGGSLVLVGIPVYFLLEMYYNSKSISFVQDILAYITLLTERIALPKKMRKEIIHLLGNIKGKSILEFGCSVGTLTLHLASEVGKKGKIYATDTSKKEVQITQRRMDKLGHKHVIVLHDEHHHRRVHPHVPNIHTAVSVGMLGYVQNINAVLKDMNKRLKNGARICFVDYDKFFDIIPNVEWLSDDKKIKGIFNRAGFNVGVIRKQGFAWKYVFIYGTKFKNV
jgi:ubiquinone/menaquinone biosynthesis C-methylase UbiE